MTKNPSTPLYSLRSRLLLLSGATFLVCAGIILLFFPLLNLTLEGAMEGSTALMEKASGEGADTIARLMVLEFSQMRELLETRPGDINEVDQRIMNLIWQKVTFNEVIRGIELIKDSHDPEGQRLTYLFYRQEARVPEPVKAPQKLVKRFVGAEGKLLSRINSPQTLEKDKLESSVYLGPKTEGQMLLRYLPVHVLVPDEGAVFWGVAKIGVDISGLADLKTMQDRERNQLRKAVWLAIILSLGIAGILAVSLLYLWARSITEPLRQLSEVAGGFKVAKPEEYELWLDNLDMVEDRGQTEIHELKEALIRLGRGIPRLGERLFACESQACLTRVAARALPTLLADSALWREFRDHLRERGQGPTAFREPGDGRFAGIDSALDRLETSLNDWHYFTREPEKDWQDFEAAPILARAWRLATGGMADRGRLSCEIDTLAPAWGSPGYLGQAVLLLLDYAVEVLPEGGRLVFRAGSRGDGSLLITVGISGLSFSLQECRELLAPPAPDQKFTNNLGPALAAAIARWHGGDLEARPADPDGLVLTLTMPPSPPEP